MVQEKKEEEKWKSTKYGALCICYFMGKLQELSLESRILALL